VKPTRFDFNSRRSMTVGTGGMVATSNPLAAQSGLQVLRDGGNAADAAVTTAALLNVTEPASTGIGGDCFALFFDAKTKSITALNGSGRAPATLDLQTAQRENPSEIEATSAHAVTVPGTVRGWDDLLKRHGTMTFIDVLKDAIHYAKDGFPVHPVFAAGWHSLETKLENGVHTEEYLPAPRAGEIRKLPGLARSFQMIAEGGADAFYTGKIAEAIVQTLEPLGGVMSLQDLEAHKSTWDDPIYTDYRGTRVWECPPNGQGLAALQALNIADTFDIGDIEWDTPERLHLLVEAMRLAFADARQYITDMATNPAPLDFLLSKEYARERAKLIDNARAMEPPAYGRPTPSSDTVYLTVVDGEGNACSFINSLYMGFGSGIVAEGTDIMLQNRGALFSLQEDHPNVLAPGKRPYHTIIPGMATRNGELYCSFGVMGGFMQPQGHLQVISALVDDNLNPQQALNRPRFCLTNGTGDSVLALEEGIPLKTMAVLAAMGHRVQPVAGRARNVFGDGHIIIRDPETGVLYGGADPRKDGTVAVF